MKTLLEYNKGFRTSSECKKWIKNFQKTNSELKVEVYGSNVTIVGTEEQLKDAFPDHEESFELYRDIGEVDLKGKFVLGNYQPEGKELNPDFIKWVQAADRFETKMWRDYFWSAYNKLRLPRQCSYGKGKYIPRQWSLLKAAELGDKVAKEWLEKHPQPEMFMTEEQKAEIVNECDQTFFGVFHDGGNCFSYMNRSREEADKSRNWYWSASDGETKAEFRKRLFRQAKYHESHDYNYYCPSEHASSYGVKVFTNIKDFKKFCERVGMHPDLSEYESEEETA